jgi:hypothetical protein
MEYFRFKTANIIGKDVKKYAIKHKITYNLTIFAAETEKSVL